MPIWGCTDPLALNFDINSNLDDGSCNYPENDNYVLYFDGVDDFVETSNSVFDFSQGGSILTYVKTDQIYDSPKLIFSTYSHQNNGVNNEF